MSLRTLILGGVAVPLHSTLELDQRYTVQQAVDRRRTANGDLHQRTTWTGKLATTINASGPIPPGLQALDYTGTLLLSCMQHRAITSASNVITLPAARRTDAGSLPYARAQVMRGDVPEWVSTGLAIVSNVATLTPVAGATAYQVLYFPEITVYADPPTETRQARGGAFGWQLVAEEV